jgi:hypothetical protein
MEDVALTDALQELYLAGRLKKGEHKTLYKLLDRADISNPPREDDSNGYGEDHTTHRESPAGMGTPSRTGVRGMHHRALTDR